MTKYDNSDIIIYGKKVKIMKFTQKQKIALNICEKLSKLKDGEVLGVNIAALELGVSARYLEQLLFLLRKKGLVLAKRGVDGGYYLSEEGKCVCAADILNAVGGSEEKGEDFSSRVLDIVEKAASEVKIGANCGIYLDNAATTKADADIVQKMLPYITDIYGNASSLHAMGRRALNAVDESRERIAACLGVHPWEIYFTCGGSESDNWAIKGTAFAMKDKGRHIITTAVEHPAVMESCRSLEREGYEVTYLPAEKDGTVDVSRLKEAIRRDTILISIMYANNESGAIMDIAKAGAVAKERGITFHTDAVQAAGHLSLSVAELNADMMSLSGHKFYCPKGVGVLYKRNKVKCDRFMDGGEQERGKRAGTLNTAGIVALGYALERACSFRKIEDERIQKMRDRFESRLHLQCGYIRVLAKGSRLASHSCITFDGVDAQALLARLDERGVYASAGSACSSGSAVLSHVLTAMGLSERESRSTLRFSFGKYNTIEEADAAADIVASEAQKLRRTDLFARDDISVEKV